ncbi:sugar phosphate isomerase/epimerase family protein [Streptomyces sp. H27-D2]|uniref:sugar phosphate isomerase/epimerase family protein n=1 Tax=Streptomyces sp. H27-D2 TaxID=3046304 RepID=UPI002DB71AF3|nr:sugar phosphate isomerase/epimerase [Streptomyces sp. H27-D2]MEC4020705.1 sugar phosphate isomerase/epimerase [Streptomyces sp. H27-D2]
MTRTSDRDNPELARTLARRRFLGVAAGTTAAALVGSAAAAPAGAAEASRSGDHGGHGGHGRPVLPPNRLGIQLYTLRDQVAKIGFARVFKELERYGYDEVEFAGYTQGAAGPITLRQLKRLTRDHGLRGVGSHVGYYSDDPNAYTFAQNLTKVLDDAQALGLPHIGTASGPWRYGSTVDGWKRCAEDFNTYGAAAKARGMKFYQHNHAEEFSFATDRPDVRLYDVLLAETDPDLVYLEMDIYWAFVAQYRFSKRVDGTPAPFEPIDYVLDCPDRYPLFHVKDGEHDEAEADGYRMVDVGDGDIDYRRFLTKVGNTRGGRKDHHWIVEHDGAGDPVTNPAGSLSTARRSARHLKSLRTHR